MVIVSAHLTLLAFPADRVLLDRWVWLHAADGAAVSAEQRAQIVAAVERLPAVFVAAMSDRCGGEQPVVGAVIGVFGGYDRKPRLCTAGLRAEVMVAMNRRTYDTTASRRTVKRWLTVNVGRLIVWSAE